MATMICLGGAFWLAVIASGLWKLVLGLKALVTRKATLRNFRFQVTRFGPVRMETPPTLLAGEPTIGYGLLQLVCGLLIAGPLGLVPLLGGGFPNTIFVSSAVGWIVAVLGTWVIKLLANHLD